ncbi:MAG: glutamate racemase [Flavobacteriales bacterium]
MQQVHPLQPIGVFDSGYGGLTVLKEILKQLPEYDFIYLGDNARAPYGSRSFETVHEFTLQCVNKLFDMGCPLVLLACNTASAKALRTIQQKDLITMDPSLRVLGVIRPTTEMIGNMTQTNEVGILGTLGTVNSESYVVEIKKFFPKVKVYQQACPLWVPIVENNEIDTTTAEQAIKKDIDALLAQSDKIDTIVLGCTHYPLLEHKIRKFLPAGIKLVSQGEIVAKSLRDYLKRHPQMDKRLSKNKQLHFYTTDSPKNFDEKAGMFFGKKIKSENLGL